jgi:hypothetical protein
MNDSRKLPGTVRFDSSDEKITGEAGQPKSNNPGLPPATACFEVRFLNQPWVWGIQVQVNLNVSPWSVVSGEIRGDICTDIGSSWKVGFGFFGGETGQLLFGAQQSRWNNAPVEAAIVNSVNQGLCHQALYMGGYPAPYPPNKVGTSVADLPATKDSYVGFVVFADSGQDVMECTIVLKDWNPCW